MKATDTHSTTDKNILMKPFLTCAANADAELRRVKDLRTTTEAKRDEVAAELGQLADHPLPHLTRTRDLVPAVAVLIGSLLVLVVVHGSEQVNHTPGWLANALPAAMLFAAAGLIGGVLVAALLPRTSTEATPIRVAVAAGAGTAPTLLVLGSVTASTRSLADALAIAAGALACTWLAGGRIHRGHQQRLRLQAELIDLDHEVGKLREKCLDRTIALDQAIGKLGHRQLELAHAPVA